MNKKKGVSPVIASVLMILLVVMLASMVFLWARGFVSEQIEKFGTPIEDQCSNIRFDAANTGGSLEIVNRGNIDIFHFDIKMTKGGNSEFIRIDRAVDSGEGVKFSENLKMNDRTSPDEMVIYPALLGSVVGKNSKKVFTCLNNGVSL
jgi:flagellin-like protein